MAFDLKRFIEALNNEGSSRAELIGIMGSAESEAPTTYWSVSKVLEGLNAPGTIRNNIKHTLSQVDPEGEIIDSFNYDAETIDRAFNYDEVLKRTLAVVLEITEGGGPGPEPVGPVKSLIVGHSLADDPITHYYHQFQVLEDVNDTASRQIIIGAPLKWNYDHTGEGKGVNSRVFLQQGNVTKLFLTEGGPFLTTFAAQDTVGTVQAYRADGITATPTMQVWIDQIWEGIPGYGETPGSPVAPDLVAWKAQTANYDEAYRFVRQRIERALGGGVKIYLAPGGPVMTAVYDAFMAGTLPDTTDFIEKFFLDGIHLTHVGQYVRALTMYAVQYKKSPVGLPWFLSGEFGADTALTNNLTLALATRLQEIVWNVVSAAPWAGVATRPADIEEAYVGPCTEHQLFLYPDPVTTTELTVDVGTARADRTLILQILNMDDEGGITGARLNPAGANTAFDFVTGMPGDASGTGAQMWAVKIPDGMTGNQTVRLSARQFYDKVATTRIVAGVDHTAALANFGDPGDATVPGIAPGSIVIHTTRGGSVPGSQPYFSNMILDQYVPLTGYVSQFLHGWQMVGIAPTTITSTVGGGYNRYVVALPRTA